MESSVPMLNDRLYMINSVLYENQANKQTKMKMDLENIKLHLFFPVLWNKKSKQNRSDVTALGQRISKFMAMK